MYVIVEINGQQFKAEEGKKLFVHHIQDAESGKTVEFEKVLLVDNNGTVTYTEPGLKGDTASSTALKPAEVETGARVMVPLFINTGEKIRIKTEDGTYVERVKE